MRKLSEEERETERECLIFISEELALIKKEVPNSVSYARSSFVKAILTAAFKRNNLINQNGRK